MVCPRCIDAVYKILRDENLEVQSIELGKVVIKKELTEDLRSKLAKNLFDGGFELILNKNEKVIEEIKSFIIKLIHHSGEIHEHLNFSEIISEKLNSDYKHLSSLFSSIEGVTIEKFVILQKVERIKELISYNEKNLSEIALYMGYSSTGHMSTQFKNQTGLTPGQFAKQGVISRDGIDNIC